ncbi:transposase, partial [Thermoflexibacter ruber]
KGYITALKEEFAERNLHLITKLRANMKKNQVLTEPQAYYLRHRGLIETAFDVLKNQLNIEHSRHRSPKNFLINLLAGLIAYTFLEKTPNIKAYPQKLEDKQIVFIQENVK